MKIKDLIDRLTTKTGKYPENKLNIVFSELLGILESANISPETFTKHWLEFMRSSQEKDLQNNPYEVVLVDIKTIQELTAYAKSEKETEIFELLQGVRNNVKTYILENQEGKRKLIESPITRKGNARKYYLLEDLPIEIRNIICAYEDRKVITTVSNCINPMLDSYTELLIIKENEVGKLPYPKYIVYGKDVCLLDSVIEENNLNDDQKENICYLYGDLSKEDQMRYESNVKQVFSNNPNTIPTTVPTTRIRVPKN